MMLTVISGWTQWNLFVFVFERVSGLLEDVAGWVSNIPWTVISVGRPSVVWMLLFFFWLCWVFAVHGQRVWKSLFGLVLVSVFFWPVFPWAHYHPGFGKVWFLDVGQGDSILLERPDGTHVLVDGGSQYSGRYVVVPALRYLGISKLDWVINSHPHADHAGGLTEVLKNMEIGQVLTAFYDYDSFTYRDFLEEARKFPLWTAENAAEPPELPAGIRLLNPDSEPIRGSVHDIHNNGLVLSVDDWLLLTGDIEKEAEHKLLSGGRLEEIKVLKVAHQGSHTSSSQEFLEHMDLEAAVIFSGRNNRYGHPHASVLRRLEQKKNLTLYRTDLQGCILLDYSIDKVFWETWQRTDQRQLWVSPEKLKKTHKKRISVKKH